MGAYIKIPLPHVPVTLQTFVVIMSGNIIGARYGAVSQIVYLATGLLGAPIFAYGGGPGYIFQPTFGYLLGYPFCAIVIGMLIKILLPDANGGNYSKFRIFFSYLFSDFVGVLTIFLFGLSYFYFNLRYGLYLDLDNAARFTEISWQNILKTGFLVFVPIDIIKVILASGLTMKLRKLTVFMIVKD